MPSAREIAKEVVYEFENITGYKPDDVVRDSNLDKPFDKQMIFDTFPDIKDYVQENYDIDLEYRQDILDALDDQLLKKVIE